MANLNKVILIGRLTVNPEIRAFNNGGRVAKFSFAVNNRKKNTSTGEWEDDPMFIDCEAYNRGESGKLADTIEKYCQKGSQICIEGRLTLDRWDDKATGQKRSKHKIVVDAVQLLDTRSESGRSEGGMSSGMGNRPSSTPRTNSGSGFSNTYEDGDNSGPSGPQEEEVPF